VAESPFAAFGTRQQFWFHQRELGLLDRLDHQWLNEFPPFDVLNPSAENMARYIYQQVAEGLKVRDGVRIALVKLWETDTAYATYRQ